MSIYDEKLEKIATKMDELRTSLEFSQEEIEKVKTTCKQYAGVNNRVKVIEQQLKEFSKDIDYIDNQTRKNNVRIDGIPENFIQNRRASFECT